MTKSLTVNIGGQLFEIEEAAYSQLRNYIDSLQDHFKNDPDGKEIVEDLEMRIAELFTELQTTEFKTILKEQVEFVKLKMGTVDEFEPIDEAYTSTTEKNTTLLAETQVVKKLMRDPDDRVLGGVCSGLGHNFNISPVTLRIILLILFFGLGFGLLMYLLMWIIIPKANTTTDKLMMKGQPINLNTVADSVKEENLRQTSKASPLLNFVGQLMNYCIKFLFAIGKVLLIIVSIALLFSAFAGIIAIGFGLLKGSIFTQSLAVSSAPVFWLIKMMSIIVFGVPVLLLFIGLIYLLLNRNYFKSSFTLPLLGIWLISLFSLVIYSNLVAKDFKEENVTKEVFDLDAFSSDTLFVGILESDLERLAIGGKNHIYITEESLKLKDSLYIDNVHLNIKPSNNNAYKLTIEKKAKGRSTAEAKERASQTDFGWKHDNDHLLLHSFLSIDKNTKWRMQKVNLTLQIPVGKHIHLGQNMDRLLDDVDNVQDMYDDEMPDKLWKMTASGLTCIGCDIEYEKVDQAKKLDTQEETNAADSFSAININGAFEVSIHQSDQHQILFNGKEKLPDNLELIRNTEREKVIIKAKKGAKKVKLSFYLSNLSELNFEGAGTLDMAGFSAERVELDLEGAIASNIQLHCHELELDIEGTTMHKLSGKATKLYANASGATSIGADKFRVREADISMEGANTASFWVTDELTIHLEGVNSVSYKGQPDIEKNLSATSTLKKEE